MKQLFNIYGQNGRAKRNIYHIGKHSMFKSFGNMREKQQPQVNSLGADRDSIQEAPVVFTGQLTMF